MFYHCSVFPLCPHSMFIIDRPIPGPFLPPLCVRAFTLSYLPTAPSLVSVLGLAVMA